MVRSFLILLLFVSTAARADFFEFGSDAAQGGRMAPLIEKLKGLDVKDGAGFEDSFNQTVKNIELAMEEEKLFCSGEATNSEGKTIGKDQKQLCFRQLKGQYLTAMDLIFTLKKKYLALLHGRHLEKLAEIHTKLKADIEKSF